MTVTLSALFDAVEAAVRAGAPESAFTPHDPFSTKDKAELKKRIFVGNVARAWYIASLLPVWANRPGEASEVTAQITLRGLRGISGDGADKELQIEAGAVLLELMKIPEASELAAVGLEPVDVEGAQIHQLTIAGTFHALVAES